MSFNVEQQDKCTVIKVNDSKLNSAVSPDLKVLLRETNAGGQKNVVLDLSDCNYCDSSGLSAILIGNRLCSGSNGLFVLSGLNDVIENLIKLSRLDTILKITPTPSEAYDLIVLNEIENEFNADD